mmetsp:Transcript_10727/g.22802  ORF Transcript_10727/g.22802 Transcript_10727/m.22802 type:complete len:268 (+) Transcript_10727:381-1184(+)
MAPRIPARCSWSLGESSVTIPASRNARLTSSFPRALLREQTMTLPGCRSIWRKLSKKIIFMIDCTPSLEISSRVSRSDWRKSLTGLPCTNDSTSTSSATKGMIGSGKCTLLRNDFSLEKLTLKRCRLCASCRRSSCASMHDAKVSTSSFGERKERKCSGFSIDAIAPSSSRSSSTSCLTCGCTTLIATSAPLANGSGFLRPCSHRSHCLHFGGGGDGRSSSLPRYTVAMQPDPIGFGETSMKSRQPSPRALSRVASVCDQSCTCTSS